MRLLISGLREKFLGKMYLVVAGRAACFWMHVEGFLELLAKIRGGYHRFISSILNHIVIAVIEIVNFLKRAEVLFWSSVAIKAPAHRMRLGLIDDFHLVDVAMAALA